MSTPSRSLTVACITGLSNRLRVLLSGMALAEASGRDFTMVWKADKPCGCVFEELFCNAWNVRSDVVFDAEHALNLEELLQAEIPDLLVSPDVSLAVRYWGWLIDPTRFPAHAALQKRSEQMMGELRPLPSIARTIADFRSQVFRPTMIGVHLRRSDFLALSPAWKGIIPFAMDCVDRYLDQMPQAGIFLSTDDGAPNPYNGTATPSQNVAGRFVRRFGKRVVWTEPASLDRHMPSAIQAALVDLWLLRCCDAIVGTYQSSFSGLAVYGRRVPYAVPLPKSSAHRCIMGMMRKLGMTRRVRRIGRDANGEMDPNAFIGARYLRRLLTHMGGRI